MCRLGIAKNFFCLFKINGFFLKTLFFFFFQNSAQGNYLRCKPISGRLSEGAPLHLCDAFSPSTRRLLSENQRTILSQSGGFSAHGESLEQTDLEQEAMGRKALCGVGWCLLVDVVWACAWDYFAKIDEQPCKVKRKTSQD
jgi:hypothetical protein